MIKINLKLKETPKPHWRIILIPMIIQMKLKLSQWIFHKDHEVILDQLILKIEK